jgi:hypothetical protein
VAAASSRYGPADPPDAISFKLLPRRRGRGSNSDLEALMSTARRTSRLRLHRLNHRLSLDLWVDPARVWHGNIM